MTDENMTEEERKEPKEPRTFSRRSFLRGAGATVVGGAAGAAVGSQLFATTAVAADGVAAPVGAPVETVVEKQVPMTFPASTGYLLVDNKKCAGCQSCMIACSTAHEGAPNLSVEDTGNPGSVPTFSQ